MMVTIRPSCTNAATGIRAHATTPRRARTTGRFAEGTWGAGGSVDGSGLFSSGGKGASSVPGKSGDGSARCSTVGFAFRTGAGAGSGLTAGGAFTTTADVGGGGVPSAIATAAGSFSTLGRTAAAGGSGSRPVWVEIGCSSPSTPQKAHLGSAEDHTAPHLGHFLTDMRTSPGTRVRQLSAPAVLRRQ